MEWGRRRFLERGGALAAGLVVTADRGRANGPRRRTRPAAAGVWPQRQYDAANTGVASTRGPSGPVAQRWATSLGERLKCAPAVADGTVFLKSDDEVFYALDAADGSVTWRVRADIGTWPSPALDADRVYVGSGESGETGAVSAFARSGGDLVWQTEVGGGVYSAPALAGGTLYVQSDSSLYAFAPSTGDIRWQQSFEFDDGHGPAVAEGTVYVAGDIGFDQSRCYALDAATGDQQWHVDLPNEASAPTVAGGRVFVASQDQFRALDAADGTELWRREPEDAVSVVVADGVVYGPFERGLAALSASDGSVQWSSKDYVSLRAPPVLADGTLYVPDHDSIRAVAPGDGTTRWQLPLGDTIKNGLAVVDGTVFAAAFDGRVYAIEAAPNGSGRPAAEIEWAPMQPTVNQPIGLTATGGSADSVAAFEWQLGGVSSFPSATGRTVTTSFAAPGTHRIRLRVVTEAGRVAETRAEIPVTFGAGQNSTTTPAGSDAGSGTPATTTPAPTPAGSGASTTPPAGSEASTTPPAMTAETAARSLRARRAFGLPVTQDVLVLAGTGVAGAVGGFAGAAALAAVRDDGGGGE